MEGMGKERDNCDFHIPWHCGLLWVLCWMQGSLSLLYHIYITMMRYILAGGQCQVAWSVQCEKHGCRNPISHNNTSHICWQCRKKRNMGKFEILLPLPSGISSFGIFLSLRMPEIACFIIVHGKTENKHSKKLLSRNLMTLDLHLLNVLINAFYHVWHIVVLNFISEE